MFLNFLRYVKSVLLYWKLTCLNSKSLRIKNVLGNFQLYNNEKKLIITQNMCLLLKISKKKLNQRLKTKHIY